MRASTGSHVERPKPEQGSPGDVRLPSTSLRITSMAAAASDDVALAVDAPRQCATPAAATPRPEAAFDNSFFPAGCEKVTERDAHKSTFGLRQLMYAPDDRHDVAVLNIADLERLDERRDRIRHRGIERRCTWWCTLQGTVVTDVLRSPFFFASFGVYAATLWVFDKPEKEHNGLYATVLTVLGAFLSFASIFLNSETYQRFRASYLASVKCQGCIFNATTCARASMRDVAARTVSRFICGAYIMAFAGLRDSHYDADEVCFRVSSFRMVSLTARYHRCSTPSCRSTDCSRRRSGRRCGSGAASRARAIGTGSSSPGL